jgi:hypothetical protein
MKRSKRPETVRGEYSALPYSVLDAAAYIGASVSAKALLNELVRQHNGMNNGRLHLAHPWLAKRGWPSKSTVDKARAELVERGLIVMTRQGGLFIGPTWHVISNPAGLDLSLQAYQRQQGAYQHCKLPPTSRRKPPTKKRECQPVHRGSTDPYTGAVSPSTDPVYGAMAAKNEGSTDPVYGDDVSNQSLPHSFDGFLRRGWKLVAMRASPSCPTPPIFRTRCDLPAPRTDRGRKFRIARRLHVSYRLKPVAFVLDAGDRKAKAA